MTKTAEMADVVLPASASWAETEGTVTNSERRVQRVRKALDPPGNARDDVWIITQLANGSGWDGERSPRGRLGRAAIARPMHGGMSWKRLESEGGLQWPCPHEEHPGTLFLHERLWEEDPQARGTAAPFSITIDSAPVDELTQEYPLRLTTGRRLTDYNTGVQTGGFSSPLRPEGVRGYLARGRTGSAGDRGGDRSRDLASWDGRRAGPDRSDPATRD